MDTQEIKKKVTDHLYWDPRVDSSDVKVSVKEGKITLKGAVKSYSAKIAAANTAWSVAGVLDVKNNLQVNYPTTDKLPSDNELKRNIEKSLLWDVFLESENIDVSIENGVVTLEGDVNEYWKLTEAENKADIIGVIDVINKLSVVPTQSILDKDIAMDVVNAIDRNADVDIDQVNVKVRNAKVTLTGTVQSRSAYIAAETSAYYTLGVEDVDNNLVVGY